MRKIFTFPSLICGFFLAFSLIFFQKSKTQSVSDSATLSDLKNENYEAIRNEFINIFNSFRTLVIAQLAALTLVGKEIFLADSFERSLGLNFVFTLVVLLPTFIGHNWLAQAVYQVSYIFVFYELPLLSKLVNKPHVNNIESHRSLWILSNRVKNERQRARISSRYNVYQSGSDGRNFHGLQIILFF